MYRCILPGPHRFIEWEAVLDSLDAERQLLQAQDQLVISEITTATDLISIYGALGGGWEVEVDRLTQQ